MKINHNTLFYHAKKHGFVKSKRKKNVDPSLYKILDNSCFVYLMGWLWADGFLQKRKQNNWCSVRIEIVSNDAQHLISLINNLNIKYSLSIRQRPDRQSQTCISFNDSEFAEYIVKNFNFDQKSYISHNVILDCIPEKYHIYFLQGYLDGDGYIGKTCIQFGSTYEQDWKGFQDLLSQLEISSKIIRYISPKNYKSSTLNINSKKHAIKFLLWLHKDHQYCLPRKLNSKNCKYIKEHNL